MIFHKPYRNYGIVFAVALMMIELLYPALSEIVLKFGVSRYEAQWLITIFLGAAMLAEFFMPIALIYLNARKMHQVIWLMGMMACFVCYFVNKFDEILLCRLFMGLSAGGLIILMRIQIEMKESNTLKGFHYAVGAFLSYHSIMSVIAPSISAYLVYSSGWQSIQCLCVLGFMIIFPVLFDWSEQLNLSSWQWENYFQGMQFLFQHPSRLRQIILAGLISSMPMSESIFSTFFLTTHFNFKILQLGLYLSTVKALDASIRLFLPYFLNKENTHYIVNVGFGLLLLSTLFLIFSFNYDALISYFIGCIIINITYNAFLIIFSVDIFTDVASSAPITGNALFGTLQFGSSFVVSMILAYFLQFNLVGFIVFNVFFIMMFFILLVPKYRFSLSFA